MPLPIPTELTRWLREQLASAEFEREERSYKWAVHLLIRGLLSGKRLHSEAFPDLLAKLMRGELEARDVELSSADAAAVEAGLRTVDTGLYGAISNLCGGRWGIVQIDWIPIAVEMGLGSDLRIAFRELISVDAPLAERIDRFRHRLEEIQSALRDRGGFKPNWTVVRPSHAFIGMLLGAYDPSRYTFYHATHMKRALEELGAPWPTVSGSERYTIVCARVQEADRAFRDAGVPVRDLIDTQSLLYVRGESLKAQRPAEPGPASAPPAPVTTARALADEILWDEARAGRLMEIAARKRPLLFSGPPGTGKTFVARALARAIALDDDHIEVVQFHPSYSYEDFMEGIRPRIGDTGGTIRYDIRPGVFRRMAKKADDDPDSLFVLIIDELNRANLPRVLGEVLYCIEYRGKEGEIQLPYSGETFRLPENLLVIATMNTADRSIALVDAALRRRFLEVAFPPDPDCLRRWWKRQGHPSIGEDAAARLERLNAELTERLDADRRIGHTYLMDPHIAEEGFAPVWDSQLRPVLHEQLYAHPDDLERLRKTFLGE